MHLDYEKHPYSGKERRLNLIYFLNKEWDSNWGGELELCDKYKSIFRIPFAADNL
jgi:Rps23 Pro-64 3,4-dihydroxylase Tpa1-like proline 4-hydroxylase